MIISFYQSMLAKIRKLDKKIELGFIMHKGNGDKIKLAKDIGCTTIIHHYFFLSKKFVNDCHKQNLKVFTWPLNRGFLTKRYLSFGVDGIESDFPNKVEKVFKELKLT